MIERDATLQLLPHLQLPRPQSLHQQKLLLLPLRQAVRLGLNNSSNVIERGTTLSLLSHQLPPHLPSLRQQLRPLLPLRQAGRPKLPCRQLLLSDRPNLSCRPSLLLSRQ